MDLNAHWFFESWAWTLKEELQPAETAPGGGWGAKMADGCGSGRAPGRLLSAH